MFGTKTPNSILSFFRPVSKQAPAKRTSPDEPLPEDAQRRSKSPRRSNTTAGQLPSKPDFPKITQPQLTSNVSLSRQNTEASSELSSAPALSDDSDGGDVIVVNVLPKTHERAKQTVSNPPVSQSFTSSASSSHRIERYGETIVTGSDDESDDSLDLDKLLDRKPVKPKPAPHKQDTRMQTRSGKNPKHTYQDTSKADQMNFNVVMEKAKRDLAKSDTQRKALEQAKKVEQESLLASSKQEPTKTTLTAETIMSRVGDLDAEKAEKFAQVIERTELIQSAQSWSFFGDLKPNHMPKFNQQGLKRRWPEFPKHSEWSIYNDSTQRDLAFISGAFEQAAAQQLPQEILLWILTQSFIEPQTDLRNTYQLMLEHIGSCISSDQILKQGELVLQGLGATTEAMSISSEQIRSSIRHHEDQLIPRDFLCIWLRNIRKLTNSISVQGRGRIMDLMLTLSLDTVVPNDSTVLMELQATLRVYIESLEENLEAKKILIESLKKIWLRAGSVHFRLQILDCIPATTYSMAQLRKRFAAASFYDDPTWLDSPIESDYLHDLGAFMKNNKQFQMTKKTNYHDLAAFIACFDIAVGAGGGEQTSDLKNTQQFNTAIDDLIGIVTTKHARIQTTGAMHISRTEVKDALSTIEKRLSFAVRTEQKRRWGFYEQSKLDSVVQR